MESLTNEELKVLELLAEASRKFHNLPESAIGDWQSWVDDVHHLQHLVMARSARRLYPDIFNQMQKSDESSII